MATTKQVVKESTVQRIQNIVFQEDGTVMSRESLMLNPSFKSIVKNHMNKFERDRVDEILDAVYGGSDVSEITTKFNKTSDDPIRKQAEEIEDMSSGETIFMLEGLENVMLNHGINVKIGNNEDYDEEDEDDIPETNEEIHTINECISQAASVERSESSKLTDEDVSDNNTEEDPSVNESNSDIKELPENISDDEKRNLFLMRTFGFPDYAIQNYLSMIKARASARA